MRNAVMLASAALCLAVAGCGGGGGSDSDGAGPDAGPPVSPAPPQPGPTPTPTPTDPGSTPAPTPTPTGGPQPTPTTIPTPTPTTSPQPTPTATPTATPTPQPTPTTTPPPQPPPAANFLTVDCRPVNDFGYVGSAQGTVQVGARSGDIDGSLLVKGTLRLSYGPYGDPPTTKDVGIEGKVDKDGQWMSGDVVSGAPELDSVFFSFLPGVDSRIDAHNASPSYQTRCTATAMKLPQGSDLVSEQTMRVTQNGDGTVTIQLHVVNLGNEPARGTTGRAKVGSATASARIVENPDFAGVTANTIRAGARGYVEVVIPASAIAHCTKPAVAIDVDRSFQSGQPNPFANDASSAVAPCLTWTTAISRAALDFDPDPFLVGKTLGNIVSSREIGRKDNALCSACHNAGAVSNSYHPPVAAGGSATINPTDVILGKTWADGWAMGFLTTQVSPKPDYLKAIVQQWLDDGAHP